LIIFPLVYSARRHFEEDGGRLRSRIDEVMRELRDIAHGLRCRGYPKTADFLERNARFMVTFAEVALEGVRIPYTTNRIERLMGEVSKRCKHQWMHWSTDGLRNILILVLVRYTDEALYEGF
jgi:transposase-like protein